jgi:hypothetical protein
MILRAESVPPQCVVAYLVAQPGPEQTRKISKFSSLANPKYPLLELRMKGPRLMRTANRRQKVSYLVPQYDLESISPVF